MNILTEYEIIKNSFLENSLSIKDLSKALNIKSKNLRLYIQGEDELSSNEILQIMNYINSTKKEDNMDNKHKIFISYNHKDEEYLERLKIHLKPLEVQKQIDAWTDSRILAGHKWEQQIEEALSSAQTAILLISADFLASSFIVNKELPPILEKAEKGGTLIIPIILKPCRFSREQSLKGFQSINAPDNPICIMNEHDSESLYDKVAQRIEGYINKRDDI